MTTAPISDFDQNVEPKSNGALSHSRINRYLLCPEQYRLHYIEKLRPKFPSSNLVFGQVLHQAIAGFFRAGEDPAKLFVECWATLREIDLAYSKKDSWEKLQVSGQALLAAFLEKAAPRLTNVRAVEQSFEITVTGLGKPFVGVVDLVCDLDGKRTVVDFKTAASSYAPHDVVLADQLTVYLLAEPDALQAAFCVLVKTKEPKIEWHVATRSGEQLAEYVGKVDLVAHDIEAGRFYKRPGMWCSWCDFLPVCLGDKQKVQETLIQVR
jgi:RecB family exonuclease